MTTESTGAPPVWEWMPDDPRLLASELQVTRLGASPSITPEKYFSYHDAYSLSTLSWDKLVQCCPLGQPKVFGTVDLLVWIGGRIFDPRWVFGRHKKRDGESWNIESSSKIVLGLVWRALEWLFEQESLLVEYPADDGWKPASGWRLVEVWREAAGSAAGVRPEAVSQSNAGLAAVAQTGVPDGAVGLNASDETAALVYCLFRCLGAKYKDIEGVLARGGRKPKTRSALYRLKYRGKQIADSRGSRCPQPNPPWYRKLQRMGKAPTVVDHY